tara:strand:+ start:6355 stop:7122 length:768 start_codon:yes stop_codon:yes gene_type:complete
MKGLNSYHKKKLLESNFYKLDFEFKKIKKYSHFTSFLDNLTNFDAIDIAFDLELFQVVKKTIRKSNKKLKEEFNKSYKYPLIFVSLETSSLSELKNENFKSSINILNNFDIDILELHIDYFEINFLKLQIKIIKETFAGQNISLRVSRKNLSNVNIIELIKSANAILENNLLIEVDGIDDSTEDNFNQTLQTISIADIIHKGLNSKIPNIKRIPILLRGGTNSYTSKLAKQCKVPYSGISYDLNYLRKFKNLKNF